jgi:hypothetical protein
MFFINLANYLILVWNFRAVAQARIVDSVISDIILASMSFTIVKRIGDAKTKAERVGYILGGAVASALGIIISHYFYGK